MPNRKLIKAQKSSDAHGNTTAMSHLSSMLWDYKDELTEVDLNEDGNKAYYNYDSSGNRTRKTVVKSNIIETRYYLGDYELYKRTGSLNGNYERETVTLSDGEKVFARIEQLDTEMPVVRYQFNNHLGSASLELDTAAAIISYEEYHPFGSTSYRSGKTETEVSLKRYKYCGKDRDDETGLYYISTGSMQRYGARYYAAWLGRFVSVDPHAASYVSWNPYNYCCNNPSNLTDPTGMDPVGGNLLTVSTVFTASYFGSSFYEKGIIFDFSKQNIQLFEYETYGNGIESNISIAIEGVTGYYPNATAQDLNGSGTINSFSAGELLYGSASEAVTSTGKNGILVGVGFSVGAIPIAVSTYTTNTTITPYNQSAKNYMKLVDAINIGINSIDIKLKSFDNEIELLNQGIGKTSRAIEDIDNSLEDQNLTKEARFDLIQDRTLMYNVRKDYINRSDEIIDAQSKLKSQKEQLVNSKNEISEN